MLPSPTHQAIFRVAACEGPEIAAKPDLSHVDVEGGRAYLIYTKGDQWCPTWVWEVRGGLFD